MTQNSRRVIVIAQAVLWFCCIFVVASAAWAGGKAPVQGADFVISKDRFSIYVKRSASKFDMHELAKLAGTTVGELRELNPESTLAVCITRDRWLYDPNGDRSSHRVWDNCPEEQRYIDFVPGEKLQLSHAFGEKPPSQESPPKTNGTTEIAPPPAPTVTPVTPEKPSTPASSASSMPATVPSSRSKPEEEMLRTELALAKRRVAALEGESREGVAVWPWIATTVVLLLVTIVLGGFGYRALQEKSKTIARMDREYVNMNNASLEANGRRDIAETECVRLERELQGERTIMNELVRQHEDELRKQERVFEGERKDTGVMRAMYASFMQDMLKYIGIDRVIAPGTNPEQAIGDLRWQFAAFSGRLTQYLAAAEEQLQGEPEHVERECSFDMKPVHALLSAFQRVRNERDRAQAQRLDAEDQPADEASRPTPPAPRPISGYPPSRVQTLPHGIGHIGDILSPQSKDRTALIEQIGTLILAAKQRGAFRIFTEGELEMAHHLSTMTVEVRTGDGICPVQICHLHDPKFVAGLRPCNGTV